MRISIRAFCIWIAAGVSVLAAPSWADVLDIPESTIDLRSPDVAKPQKGASRAQVLAGFGPPIKKYSPVGGKNKHQPPITRWEYPEFVVFFEHSHVVDVVVPGRPPSVQKAEELEPLAR